MNRIIKLRNKRFQKCKGGLVMDMLVKTRHINTTLLFYSDEYETKVTHDDTKLYNMLMGFVSSDTVVSVTYYSDVSSKIRVIITHFPEGANNYRCTYFRNGIPMRHTYDLKNVIDNIVGVTYYNDIWVKVVII